MYRIFVLHRSSNSLRDAYPVSINPNKTVFSMLTRLYPGLPSLKVGCGFRYFSISISSMILSNANTGSQISRNIEKICNKEWKSSLFWTIIVFGIIFHRRLIIPKRKERFQVLFLKVFFSFMGLFSQPLFCADVPNGMQTRLCTISIYH